MAHEFADLHDRAGRMKAKGCISEVLEWKSSRRFFYWRIRRRQLEDQLKDRLVSASNGQLAYGDASAKVAGIVPAGDDKAAVQWLMQNALAADNLVKQVRFDFASSGVLDALRGLTPEEMASILAKISKK